MGIDDYIEIALRYDTLMSRAMLMACGYTREQGFSYTRAPETEYEGMRECFENRYRAPLRDDV